jgi:hypothetical protein
MKRITLSVLLVIILSSWVAAVKPPDAVLKAFKAKFAQAEKVSWSKENAHEYEAEFSINKLKYSANFSETGTWLETESTSSFDGLPEKVKKNFNESHKGAVIKAVSRIETNNGITKYEIEIKMGRGAFEYFYTEDGLTTYE